MGIDFAHRTFSWTNDATGKAAVHCVIIGFSARPKPAKLAVWTYATVKGDPEQIWATNINAYLLDAPQAFITSRANPLSPFIQPMDYGSMPNDGGHLSNLSTDDAAVIQATDLTAAKYLRRIVGAKELIHNSKRYCLWLVGANPSDLRTSPVLSARISAVRELREASPRKATQVLANRPSEFGEIRQPKTDYIVVPLHTSEDREYVPIARMTADIITNNAVAVVADATLTTFGLLTSKPFNAWNKAVSGRIKNDTRISNTITYNNFPFPDLTDKQRATIDSAAQAVLDARDSYPENSLADLYNRNGMPSDLRKAHSTLDKAVLAAFGLKAAASDERILEKLFTLYAELTRGLLDLEPDRPRKAKPLAA